MPVEPPASDDGVTAGLGGEAALVPKRLVAVTKKV